jgi:hypothetical protein
MELTCLSLYMVLPLCNQLLVVTTEQLCHLYHPFVQYALTLVSPTSRKLQETIAKRTIAESVACWTDWQYFPSLNPKGN